MILFDSHCHIDDIVYKKDFVEVIKRANNANVKAMMAVGINVESSKKCVLLSQDYDNIYSSVGIHPHDATTCSDDALKMLIALSKESKVKAWGEIGLDFNRMYSPQQDQESCFIKQINIAVELSLPIIFHERDSKGRLLEIINMPKYKDKIKGVIHCFSGTEDELKKYLDLGLYIGVTGILTLKKRGELLRKLANIIPCDKILIETDAPYLTPAPEKNHTRRNEPSFVKSVLIKLAEIKGKDPDKLSEIIWKNTFSFFKINNRG